jgi:hypothetical protein
VGLVLAVRCAAPNGATSNHAASGALEGDVAPLEAEHLTLAPPGQVHEPRHVGEVAWTVGAQRGEDRWFEEAFAGVLLGEHRHEPGSETFASRHSDAEYPLERR